MFFRRRNLEAKYEKYLDDAGDNPLEFDEWLEEYEGYLEDKADMAMDEERLNRGDT